MTETTASNRLNLDDYRSIIDENERNEVLKTAFQLGKQGLLFPDGLTRGEIAELLMRNDNIISELISNITDAGLDDYDKAINEIRREAKILLFQSAFEIDDGRAYRLLKEKLFAYLKEDDSDYERIRQIISAFEAGLYFPCACGIMSMIEGTMGKTLGSSDTRWYRLFSLISEQSLHPEKEIICEGLKGFVSELVKSSNFGNDQEPALMNRHWLLHGRSKRSVERYDCLSLLEAYKEIYELLITRGNGAYHDQL